jgi:hypothetical protein
MGGVNIQSCRVTTSNFSLYLQVQRYVILLLISRVLFIEHRLIFTYKCWKCSPFLIEVLIHELHVKGFQRLSSSPVISSFSFSFSSVWGQPMSECYSNKQSTERHPQFIHLIKYSSFTNVINTLMPCLLLSFPKSIACA